MLTCAVRIDTQQLHWCGRLAQVDRALVSGTKGRAFESRIAHHDLKRAFGSPESPFEVLSHRQSHGLFKNHIQTEHTCIKCSMDIVLDAFEGPEEVQHCSVV